MPDLAYLRSEIERMRTQILRQRKEILALQRAGISTLSAEALLVRMQATVDRLCAERDKTSPWASLGYTKASRSTPINGAGIAASIRALVPTRIPAGMRQPSRKPGRPSSKPGLSTCQSAPRLTFKNGGISATGPSGNMRRGNAVRRCRFDSFLPWRETDDRHPKGRASRFVKQAGSLPLTLSQGITGKPS